MKTIRYFFCLLVLAALPLAAQTGNGTVQGTVLDTSKAVVPGSRVTLKNTATGVAQTAESTAVGVYHFGSVQPGPYSLSVQLQGFKTWETTFTVEVGQTVAMDPILEVGSVGSTLEVTGAAPVVTTEGMQVSDVKDALRIRQLPLNGRSITNLFNLTAGMEGDGNPRANGMKVGSTEMLLDGISLVDRFGGGMASVQPGMDAIQEYRVETAGSSAQYSRPATVTLLSVSGTNALHGAVFETFRNNFGGLRARQRQDLPANAGDTFRQPQYIRNEYGVSAGGPAVKNKTFWFFAYEGSRQRLGRFARTSTPTAAMWNGDFSNAITDNEEPITIYNPFSTMAGGARTPFADNKIPASLIAPISKTMQSISPEPTGLGNPWVENNFQTYYPDQTDMGTITMKGDHVFSERDNVSGRFTRSESTYKLFGGRYGYPKPGVNAGGSSLANSRLYSTMARWNHVFSPTLLNEFQASNHRAPKSYGTLANDVNWADKLGLPNPFAVTGWPSIGLTESFLGGGWDGDNRNDQRLTAFQIDDNVTWIKGKHSVRFGFKGRQEFNNVRELQQAQGSHGFYNDWTGLYDPENGSQFDFTGSGLATLELGIPSYLSNQYNRGYFYFRQKEIGAYLQDSWRVSPRVTLDLGLRWDKWTVYHEKYNRLTNVDLNNYANAFEVITPGNVRMEDMPGVPPAVLASWKLRGLSWVTASSAGFPASLLPADNNNFGPRLGVAIRLTNKWVLRSGFGRYFWTMPLSQILQTSRTNPPLNLRFQNDFSNLNGAQDFYSLWNAPATNDFVGKAVVDTSTIQGIGSRSQSMMAWDARNWKDDQADEWTLTVERELMKDTSLRLSYIGNHGSNLEQRFSVNVPESEYNYQARTGLATSSGNADVRRINRNWNFSAANHTGYSNTNSFQAEVQRRYSNGLQFQGFYTYAHSLSTSDAGGSSSGNADINARSTGVFGVPDNSQLLGAPNLSYEQRLRLGYYNSGYVPAHRVRWNGIYDLPFGKGKRWGGNASRALNHAIGGWQLSFLGDWGSGNWIGVSSSKYLFGDPTLSADQRLVMTYNKLQQRLWFRGDMEPSKATGVDQAALQALVPLDRSQRVLRPVGSDFTNKIPQTLADGTVRSTSITDNVNWNARNFFRGPGSWNQDISVFKNFQITERVKTRFTADFFNALNHANDGGVDAATGLQDLSTQANDPRIVQFSLRVEW